MTGIEPHPNVLDIFIIQGLQRVRVIDDHMFLLAGHVHHDNQPILQEHFKIVKQHRVHRLS